MRCLKKVEEGVNKTDIYNTVLKVMNIFEVIQRTNEIKLFLKENFLEGYKNVYVAMQNIKTGQIFACNFKIDSEAITINLNELSLHFTDYEGVIHVIASKDGKRYRFLPILKNKTKIKTLDGHTGENLKWHIRLNEKGELRFSTVTTRK